MWCVCAQSYIVQSKKIFDHFICFWKWFLSLFVFMFSAYFVFHCLTMFCIEKQVSEFFVAQLATRQSRNPNREFIQKLLAAHLRLVCNSLVTHSRLAKIFATETRDSRLARDSLATRENFRDWNSRLAAETRGSRLSRDWTSRLAQSQIAQKQLFNGLFVGNLF